MDPESSIAKVRNKLSPIVCYFDLRKMMDNGEIEESKREAIQKLIDEQYQMIQNSTMDKLLLLIKNDSIWEAEG